jgi:hypothetical protein
MEISCCLNAIPGLILAIAMLAWVWNVMIGNFLSTLTEHHRVLSTLGCALIASVIALNSALCLGFSEVHVTIAHFTVWMLCMAPVFTAFIWWPRLVNRIPSRLHWPTTMT